MYNGSKEIIYVATGDKYMQEVLLSAQTARDHNSNVKLSLFTDDSSTMPNGLFDVVKPAPYTKNVFAQKILCMSQATEDKCLFLDTDTLVCGDIDQVFNLLDRFDISASHASWRFSPGLHGKDKVVECYMETNAPPSFVDFNTGVVLFKRSPEVLSFFREWMQVYENQLLQVECYPANDQAAFRIALWNSNLRLYVLPPEYNYRADFPGFLGSEVKIVHGRHPRLREVASYVNSKRGARVFDPETWQILFSPLSEN